MVSQSQAKDLYEIAEGVDEDNDAKKEQEE